MAAVVLVMVVGEAGAESEAVDEESESEADEGEPVLSREPSGEGDASIVAKVASFLPSFVYVGVQS